MLAPCSGIRGGPRKIARPAKCGGPGANNRESLIQEFEFIFAYVISLFCLILLLCQGQICLSALRYKALYKYQALRMME